MSDWTEKRIEKRLRYSWPIWFGDNFEGVLSQGQMVDISSGGAAFTCYNDANIDLGQDITARFSVPKYENDDSFDMENFICSGSVCRVQPINNCVRKVAIQFSQSLPFKPGEQTEQAEEFEKVLN